MRIVRSTGMIAKLRKKRRSQSLMARTQNAPVSTVAQCARSTKRGKLQCKRCVARSSTDRSSNDKSSKGASNASKVRSKTLTQKLKSVVRSNESEESRQQRKKDYKDLKLGSRVVFGMAGGPQANA